MIPVESQVLAGTALLIGAVGCVAFAGAVHRSRTIRIRRQIKRVTEQADGTAIDGFFARFSIGLGKKILRRSTEVQEIVRLLRGAGYYSPNGAYIFVAAQVATAAVLASIALATPATSPFTSRLWFTWVIAGVAVGYLAPRFGLRILVNRHQRRLGRELPLFIDMLLLLLRSGVGLERCFREVEQLGADAIPGIHATVKLLLIDLDQGRGYEEALSRWADRMSEPSALEVSQQLQQALRHGTEISKILGALAQRLIEQRLMRARETAGKRSSIITLITVAFFLPPLLIVLGAPGFSQLIQAFSGMRG